MFWIEKEQSVGTDAIEAFREEDHAEMPKVPQETSLDSGTCDLQQSGSDKKACSSDVVVDSDEATTSVSEKAASHHSISQSCIGDQSIKEASSPPNHGPTDEQSQESVTSTDSSTKVPASAGVDSNVSSGVVEKELYASMLSVNDVSRASTRSGASSNEHDMEAGQEINNDLDTITGVGPRDMSRSGESTKDEVENTISSFIENDMEVREETTNDSDAIAEVEIHETDSTDNEAVDIAPRKEPTGTYRDLTSAKKNLDASSMAFIERLRGAAHRRKLRVARSRDSLAAKEKEHLLSIASANERRQLMASKEAPVNTHAISTQPTAALEPSYKPFKARPVPSTTGHVGNGGQIGVPKVEKKPATTPFSPLLGARRPQKEKLPSINSPTRNVPRRSTSRLVSMVAESLTPKKSKSRGHSASMTFKARPAPPTTGFMGQGGQVGVPKVTKRPVTVPESPSLGNRRSSLPTTSKPKPPAFQPPRHSISRKNVNSAKPFTRILAGNDVSSLDSH